MSKSEVSNLPLGQWLNRRRSRVLHDAARVVLPSSLLVTRGRSDRRRVALTFDDGPDAMTKEYLYVLDQLDVRATFFVLGANVARDPAVVHEVVRRGHEVAAHGFTHRPFPGLTSAELKEELGRTQAVLPRVRSRRFFVRPPKGAVSLRSLALTAAAGYCTALWSRDSDDCRTLDPSAVEDRLDPRLVRPGEIILLHENQTWTLDALPRAVARLRSAGYELTTLSGVLA